MARTRSNKTRFLILGLLSEGPLSGYEIRRLTQLRFRFFWSESYGQLYPELARLEAEGLIAPVKTPGGGRQRNVYRSTPAGTRALKAWLKQSVEPETHRFEILLKVYFSAVGDAEDLQRHVSEFRDRTRGALQQLEGAKASLQGAPDPHHNHDRVLLALDFGLRTYQAWVGWADQVLTPAARKGRS